MSDQERKDLAARIRKEIAATRREVAEIPLPHPPQEGLNLRVYWEGIGRVEALADVLLWLGEPFVGEMSS